MFKIQQCAYYEAQQVWSIDLEKNKKEKDKRTKKVNLNDFLSENLHLEFECFELAEGNIGLFEKLYYDTDYLEFVKLKTLKKTHDLFQML